MCCLSIQWTPEINKWKAVYAWWYACSTLVYDMFYYYGGNTEYILCRVALGGWRQENQICTMYL